MTISSDSMSWDYEERLDYLDIPNELRCCIKENFPMGFTIQLQLESDGAIYIVPKDSELPSTNLSEQPNGFPIHPSG